MTEKEIEKLLINSSNDYYNDGNSKLSDEEFDKLKDELYKLNPNNSFFKKIGSEEKGDHWRKVSHGEYKMGSLSKCNTEEEFLSWFDKQKSDIFVVQEKLDGISVSLHYESEILVSAVTRGNGLEGENIYRNVIKMKNVPLKIDIPDSFIVRAEIIMTHTDFKSLPSELKMKNPRNAAAGISKGLNSLYCNKLSVIVTEIMKYENLENLTRNNVLTFIKKLGFKTVNQYKVSSVEEIKEIYNHYSKIRI